MKGLVEVRWHGRGGQGAKTAAQFLAEAALETGKNIQAFPEYGPERAGAPIRTYTRISEKPINLHCGVANPEYVVVIDPTLVTPAVVEGLTDKGVLIVNTKESPDEIRKKTGFKAGKIATVDATQISLDTLGRPMPNMPMLGALVKVVPLVDLDVLSERVKGKFLKKIGEEKTNANIQGIKRAYEEVKVG
ncbi:MAG: 2-oxoacid:acceptor oxidoreductase family protein [Candidatus Omnitrophica bacterium]|nr:2-oxoacid:acceptor oxidoreductase family protein [Candidatus Omnitrophota bacterium]